nr:hypothetical protein [Azospirillum oleiclasticum]
MDGIEVLVTCVGIQRDQTLMEVTETTFDAVYQTNLKSATSSLNATPWVASGTRSRWRARSSPSRHRPEAT